jgi:hypothetical protein
VLPAAPYNPYVFVYNTGYDIHLIGREANTISKNSDDPFVDADGFPWALLVPRDWAHPDEGKRIENFYEGFTIWRTTGGAEAEDWYDYYEVPYPEDPPPASQVDAYVSGTITTSGVSKPVYWVVPADGSPAQEVSLPLPAGISEGGATDIYVATDGTVYTSGYFNDGSIEVPVYWIDETIQQSLPDVASGATARATGITLSGGQVYISGTIKEGGSTNEALYWFGAPGTPLTARPLYSGAPTASADEILVDGSDVYVAGTFNSGSNSFSAVYWRNGTPLDLGGDALSQAFDVDVDPAGGVYVAGYYLAASNIASAYWVNASGTPIDLFNSSIGGQPSIANGIDVGASIAVAGYYRDGVDRAVVWIDGTPTVLNQSLQGRASDVEVDGSVEYVTGWLGGTSGREAVLWVDGSEVDLSDATLSQDAEPTAVFLDIR